MKIDNWLKRLRRRTSEDGVLGIKESLAEIPQYLYREALSLNYPSDQYIYDSDWDVLIILDACRLDLMKEVEGEYNFINDVGEFVSAGSTSIEWLENNFSDKFTDSMSETYYICGNPFSEQALDRSDFLKLEEVWRDDWDSETGTVKPRSITDRAISAYRSSNPPRMILHYMQPHHPFINDGIGEGIDLTQFGEDDSLTPWDLIEDGRVDEQSAWNAYSDNLRYVLDDVSLLLDNLSAEKVIITADHGNSMGERGIYGHPYGWPLDSLKKVPWVETSAIDSGEYQPNITKREVDATIEDRLDSLGYK